LKQVSEHKAKRSAERIARRHRRAWVETKQLRLQMQRVRQRCADLRGNRLLVLFIKPDILSEE